MATRLKTVRYAFAVLASLVNNTLTNVPQLTVNLPENAKSFQSVIANISFDDIITATGGTIANRTFNLRLGAAAYTSVASASPISNTGENISAICSVDFTSHFTANWTGTSMTCDVQVLLNQNTGTTFGMVNVCVTLEITYTYDDTSATQIKTVMWPLNAPVGALTTGAVTYDTIPALDTELPEAGKVYRNIHLVVQGNEARNALTTDHTLTLNVGTATITTGNYEGALASDRFFRYVWNLTADYPSKAATQAFQMSATVARCNHLQAYLAVTYEFDVVTTTRAINSVLLCPTATSPMGGTTNAEFQRLVQELYIEEPGTITTESIAFFAFWQQFTNIGGLNFRVGTGAFVAYTDIAATMCGSNAAMVRNDAAFTLARGKNTLNFDAYRTDTTDYGWGLGGFFLVNYSSDVSPQGVGAHNKTVSKTLLQSGAAGAGRLYTSAALGLGLPDANYFINNAGLLLNMTPAGNTPLWSIVAIQKLAAEGGQQWLTGLSNGGDSDGEVGSYLYYGDMSTLFKRFPGDVDVDRLNINTARLWRVYFTASNSVVPAFPALSAMVTYHSITFTCADSITGFTGTVALDLHRSGTGEKVLSTTRAGDGAFSFTWYDNTEQMFVSADNGTIVGRSQDTLAA